MTITEAELASLTFGCELEYEGITQERAAKVVAQVTGGTARYEGYHLHNWTVTTGDGRKWQVVSDGSLWGGAEVVTPIMTYADMETLQEVVRAMRKAKAKVNSRTGLHVHVGAQGMTPTQIKNLVKIFYKHYHDIPVITTFSICGVIVEMKPQKTRDNSQHFSPYNFFKSSSLSTLHSLMPLPSVSCVLFFSVSTIACRFISVSA